MGHLLHLTQNVSQREMHRNEQDSKTASKASFAFAWVLDGTAEERQRCGVHRASEWGSLGPAWEQPLAVSVDRVVVCGLGAAESPPAVLLRATGAAVRCTCTMRARLQLQAAEAVNVASNRRRRAGGLCSRAARAFS